MQIAGSAIPGDADISDERKAATRAVDVDEVMSTLEACGSDTNIVVLDACRNNPLPASSGRSASRGLGGGGQQAQKLRHRVRRRGPFHRAGRVVHPIYLAGTAKTVPGR